MGQLPLCMIQMGYAHAKQMLLVKNAQVVSQDTMGFLTVQVLFSHCLKAEFDLHLTCVLNKNSNLNLPTLNILVGCCTTIELTLMNAAFENQGSRQGYYQIAADPYDGKVYYTKGTKGIWFVSQHGQWIIGSLNVLGKNVGGLYATSDSFCPNNVTNAGDEWKYYDSDTKTWIVAVNDIQIECMPISKK